MTDFLVIVLISLSTYRLTRFVTRDAFPPMAATRGWVIRRFGDEHWISYLIECSWCSSIWLSGAVTGVTVWSGVRVHVPVLVWLSASAITGLIVQREPDDDDDDDDSDFADEIRARVMSDE